MQLSKLLLVTLSLYALGCASSTPSRPHIIFMLSDDYGWGNVGYHNQNNPDVVTPNINSMIPEGIELDRHYAYQFCSPTRSALLSGRNPIHVNGYNLVQNYNPAGDNITNFAGIPLHMTLISQKLQQAGYTTKHTGKWDVGFATTHHLAVNRGFDTSFGYFGHANDYWAYNASCNAIDLWSQDSEGYTGPAYAYKPADHCGNGNNTGCLYEDDLFTSRVLDELDAHDVNTPLFYYWAMHSAHEPLAPPQSYLDKFSFIDTPTRQVYAAQTNYMDDNIGKVIAKLKEKGIWDNAIVVWSSDNGGPVKNMNPANNWPLKGGKNSNWEGGIRVNGIVTGGFVPESLRGTKSTDFVAIWDWYATFCALAGVDSHDYEAEAFDLPPIDSYNVWPLLSKQNTTNPRTEIAIGYGEDGEPGVGLVVQGIIVPPYKLLIDAISLIDISFWQGVHYPNTSTVIKNLKNTQTNCTKGCLFNIIDDPNETVDISAANPDVVARLKARVNFYQPTVLNSDRGNEDPQACTFAAAKGGWISPWVDISSSYTPFSYDSKCGVTFFQQQTGAWTSGDQQFTQWQVTINTGDQPLYSAELKINTHGATSFSAWNINQEYSYASIYTIPDWQYQNGAIPAHSSSVTFGYQISSATAASITLNNAACVQTKTCDLSAVAQLQSSWTSGDTTYQSVTLQITNNAATAAANVDLQFDFQGGAYLSSQWNLSPKTTYTAGQASAVFTAPLWNLAPGASSTSSGFILAVLTANAQAINVAVSEASAVCL